MKFLRSVSLLLIIALCGCSTSFYYSKAVSKARAYAIEKMPELSEKSRHCIKFTPPRMLQSRLLIREGAETDSRKDVVQTCMVWPYPDQEGMYIVVSGVSERRLDDWSPTRVLLKKFDELPAEKTQDKDTK